MSSGSWTTWGCAGVTPLSRCPGCTRAGRILGTPSCAAGRGQTPRLASGCATDASSARRTLRSCAASSWPTSRGGQRPSSAAEACGSVTRRSCTATSSPRCSRRRPGSCRRRRCARRRPGRRRRVGEVPRVRTQPAPRLVTQRIGPTTSRRRRSDSTSKSALWGLRSSLRIPLWDHRTGIGCEDTLVGSEGRRTAAARGLKGGRFLKVCAHVWVPHVGL
mmetsp:Transcript_64982/g.181674  ORF Transcript_64982/g.181674 Transcript_64982/m.181674 type:complete len:219 (-) Transcript_64982:392-1048(-)